MMMKMMKKSQMLLVPSQGSLDFSQSQNVTDKDNRSQPHLQDVIPNPIKPTKLFKDAESECHLDLDEWQDRIIDRLLPIINDMIHLLVVHEIDLELSKDFKRVFSEIHTLKMNVHDCNQKIDSETNNSATQLADYNRKIDGEVTKFVDQMAETP